MLTSQPSPQGGTLLCCHSSPCGTAPPALGLQQLHKQHAHVESKMRSKAHGMQSEEACAYIAGLWFGRPLQAGLGAGKVTKI